MRLDVPSLTVFEFTSAHAAGWPARNGWVVKRQDASSCVLDQSEPLIFRKLRMQYPVPAAPNHSGRATQLRSGATSATQLVAGLR